MKHAVCIALASVLMASAGNLVRSQDSLNVSMVAEVVFWDGLNEVVKSGNYLYASAGAEGLHIFDVSDPEDPIEVGCCNTPGFVEEIVLSGNIAYVADDTCGLRAIDVSDPYHPFEIGCYNTAGHAHGLEARNDYVYLADGWQGFRIVDVSNPANPTETGYLPLGGWDPGTNKIALYGNYAYVTYSECECGWGGQLFVIDITDPSDPLIVDSLGTEQYVTSAEIFDHYLCTASFGNYYGIYIYDVTDPYNVVQVSLMGNFFEPGDVFVVGSTMYVTDFTEGLSVVDVSNPGTPVLLGSSSIVSYPHGITVENGLAYVGGWQSGLTILDISDPLNIATVSSLNRVGVNQEVILSNGCAFVANENMGLCVFDITLPQNPSFVTNCDVGDGWKAMDIEGNYCYMVSDENFYNDDGYFYIIDISNPQEPFMVSETFYIYDLTGIEVFESIAYLGTVEYELMIVDVSDPHSPSLVNMFNIGGMTQNIEINGRYAYAAADNYGLVILNVEDPTNPFTVGVFPDGEARDVAVVGDIAYLAASGHGLYAIDVSNPNNPVQVARLFGGAWHDIEVVGNHLYGACYWNGFKVINVTNPDTLIQTGYYELEDDAYGVAVDGDYSYIAADDEFVVLDHSVATGVNHTESVTILRGFALSQPYPNPFNPTTVLTYSLSLASAVELKVYDLLGRKVAEVVSGWKSAGVHRVIFNGTNLPSGIYFARLTSGDFQQTQKLLLVK